MILFPVFLKKQTLVIEMNVHFLSFALKIITLLQWWYVKKMNVKNEAKCKIIIFLLFLSLFLLACNIFIAKNELIKM